MLKTIPLNSVKVNNIPELITTFNHLVKPSGLSTFIESKTSCHGSKRQANRRNHL